MGPGFKQVVIIFADFPHHLDGRALLVNFKRGVVIHHFNFQKPVKDIKVSPDGKYVFAKQC